MSKQVLSIEQMNHLQKLGLDTSNASFVKIEYDEHDGENRHLISILVEENHYLNDDSIKDSVNVYTLQDILDKLPPSINWNPLIIVGNSVMYSAGYGEGYDHPMKIFKEKSLLESAYNMLCWLYENDYLPFKN
ncbi:hypothetical protein [Bacteroides sp. MSB163]|uniref:hypothetical protein n=1 Tax=Bacteroides maternus TaxID=3117552 RepID=UPI002EDADF39